MKKNKKILFVTSDDWVSLIVDGKLVYENHSIDNQTLLSILGIPFEAESIEDDEDGDKFFKFTAPYRKKKG